MRVLQKKLELCTQCRACEKECSTTWFKEENAEKARIQVYEDNLITCTQCGECIGVCQVRAITRDKFGVVKIDKDICINCFMCVGFCPESAMIRHLDSPVPFKCVACGKCTHVCPTQAITLIK